MEHLQDRSSVSPAADSLHLPYNEMPLIHSLPLTRKGQNKCFWLHFWQPLNLFVFTNIIMELLWQNLRRSEAFYIFFLAKDRSTREDAVPPQCLWLTLKSKHSQNSFVWGSSACFCVTDTRKVSCSNICIHLKPPEGRILLKVLIILCIHQTVVSLACCRGRYSLQVSQLLWLTMTDWSCLTVYVSRAGGTNSDPAADKTRF